MSTKLCKNYGISLNNYKWYLNWTIPKNEFIKRSECGVFVQESPNHEEVPWNLARIFNFFCHPNGESKKSEGFSLMLQEKTTMFQYCILNVTFSLVDVDGNLRFPQSFAKYYGETFLRPHKASPKPFGLIRYIKRSSLLSSDVADSEMLRVQCDIHFYKEETLKFVRKVPYMLRYPKGTLYRTSDYTEAAGTLFISTTEHPLWAFLSDNSPYFRKLLVENRVTQIESFYRDDYRALNTINKCILNREDPKIFDIDEAFALYKFADMVLIPQFKQNSGDFLKEHMRHNIVCIVIVLADMHSDPLLKNFAIQYASSHWKDVIATTEWEIFQKQRPDLVAEIKQYSSAEENNFCKKFKKEDFKMATRKNPQHLDQYHFYQ